jgi:hypothetical protein
MWHNDTNGLPIGNNVCNTALAGNQCLAPITPTYCNGLTVGPPPMQLPIPACPQMTYVSGTWDDSVVQPYFSIAQNYGFANYFFQTSEGPSYPAHQFIFSGTPAPTGTVGGHYYDYFASENPTNGKDTGCAGSSTSVKMIDQYGNESGNGGPDAVLPCFSHNTLASLLDSNGVSWKYYDQYNGAKGIWSAPNSISEICEPFVILGGDVQCGGQDWLNDVIPDSTQLLKDLGGNGNPCGNLAQVSWVIPNGDRTDHPGFSGTQNNSIEIEGGPAWVSTILSTLGNSPCVDSNGQTYWQDTAVFITWDDWGGWWDHINPDQSSGGPGVFVQNSSIGKSCDPTSEFGCGYTYGFRVPLLVVSAYTPAGYVSGNTATQGEVPPYIHDFGSILAFVENNFGLGMGHINWANQYYFADFYAPELRWKNTWVPLSDFFNQIPPNQPRQFVPIAIPSAWQGYNYNYFINYFANGGQVLDPDNDVVDND